MRVILSLYEVQVSFSMPSRLWQVDVRKGEIFPADLVLLSSSGHDGIAYVQTANLDG